jgi:sirohydrochlorin ferrochelatase
MEGDMDSQYERNAFWSDFARRFEERMARRAARWQARAERRAARYERWAGWSGRMGPGAFTPPPQGGRDPALQAQVDAMARTIRELTDRVVVLEKVTTDPETKLREEIEKLRREDSHKDAGEGRGS